MRFVSGVSEVHSGMRLIRPDLLPVWDLWGSRAVFGDADYIVMICLNERVAPVFELGLCGAPEVYGALGRVSRVVGTWISRALRICGITRTSQES